MHMRHMYIIIISIIIADANIGFLLLSKICCKHYITNEMDLSTDFMKFF